MLFARDGFAGDGQRRAAIRLEIKNERKKRTNMKASKTKLYIVGLTSKQRTAQLNLPRVNPDELLCVLYTGEPIIGRMVKHYAMEPCKSY
jgi:hypothetical protein